MRHLKTADHRRNILTYENFITHCPECNFVNIFNRRDDLKTIEPIITKKVKCSNIVCNTEFYISGDMLAEKYEYFIYEAQSLMLEKKYMHTVTMLCTACESFFYHAVKVKLVYEPFKDKVFTNLEVMNMLFKLVDKNIEYFTFEPMRELFIYLYFGEMRFSRVDELVQLTKKLPKLKFKLSQEVEALAKNTSLNNDTKKKQLYDDFCTLNINNLRNQVVHKLAYRPTSDQAQAAIDHVTKVITSAKVQFDIQGEDNYINNNFRQRRR